MARVLIALGGNVGDVRATLAAAIDDLTAHPDVALRGRSHDYVTPAWGDTDQPAFVNACIAIETSIKPHALLALLQEIERLHGRDRTRERRWGPRTLDLDMIDYEGVTLRGDDLTLPHPRLFERAFVLVPLTDIAGDIEIAGRRVADAAASIPHDGIIRLGGDVPARPSR